MTIWSKVFTSKSFTKKPLIIPFMIIYEPATIYHRKEIESVLMQDEFISSEYFRKFMLDNNLNPMQEHGMVAFLNRKNYVVSCKALFAGGATSCIVEPRAVFREALMHNATAIVLCHNHPSGDPYPSSGDQKITRQIREAGQIIDITLLDHIVLGERENDPNSLGYYSFRNAGLI